MRLKSAWRPSRASKSKSQTGNDAASGGKPEPALQPAPINTGPRLKSAGSCGSPAQLNRRAGRIDRSVHPARPAGIYQIRQWPGIYRSEGAGLDRCRGRQNRLHRTWVTPLNDCKQSLAGQRMGERILRKLQCPIPRRTAQRRNLLQLARGANPDRAMAHPLQHDQAPQLFGLSSARARKHRSNGPEADDALTIKPDHPMGARHSRKSMLKARPIQITSIAGELESELAETVTSKAIHRSVDVL